MDQFMFRKMSADIVAIDDIPGESQRTTLDAVWGSDGASLEVPYLDGMHVDPVIPGLAEADFLFG
jgi:hypothetical protein